MKAIKEWASIVCALESGAQTVLLRKGGIHDAPSGFREESGTFLLFPTYEHQKREHLKESGIQYATKSDANAPLPGKVCIRSTAEVLRGADVDAKTAEKLGAFHVWSEEFVRARDKWMPEKPMRAIFLKVNTIKPVEIENISEYSGCRSWLDINIDIKNSMQVLDSAKLASELEKFEDIVS